MALVVILGALVGTFTSGAGVAVDVVALEALGTGAAGEGDLEADDSFFCETVFSLVLAVTALVAGLELALGVAAPLVLSSARAALGSKARQRMSKFIRIEPPKLPGIGSDMKLLQN